VEAIHVLIELSWRVVEAGAPRQATDRAPRSYNRGRARPRSRTNPARFSQLLPGRSAGVRRGPIGAVAGEHPARDGRNEGERNWSKPPLVKSGACDLTGAKTGDSGRAEERPGGQGAFGGRDHVLPPLARARARPRPGPGPRRAWHVSAVCGVSDTLGSVSDTIHSVSVTRSLL